MLCCRSPPLFGAFQLNGQPMKRALVTGASGVIGRALMSELAAASVSVVAVDRVQPRFPLTPGTDFRQIDLLQTDLPLKELVAGCDTVFHLAARMPQARLDEAGFHRENVEVTERILDASAKAGVERFLFASTIEVYGVQEIRAPLEEEDAMVFTGPYSHNKWEVEQHLLSHAGDEMATVALRMPMIFGPGFYHEKSMIALFWALRAGLPIPLPASDVPVSFVSSRDTARAFMLAASKPEAKGQSFNVAAADHPPMRDFFAELAQRLGSRSRPFVLPRRWVERAVAAAQRRGTGPDDKVPILGTPVELVPYLLTGGAYSIRKARSVLGFEPVDRCSDAWIGAYRWYWEVGWRERFHVTVRQHV